MRIRRGTGVGRSLILSLVEAVFLAFAGASCGAQEALTLPCHEIVTRLTEGPEPADSVAFSRDGEILAFARRNERKGRAETVTLIDVRTRKATRVLEGQPGTEHDRTVTSLAITRDRALVIAAVQDLPPAGGLLPLGEVVAWEVASGKVVARFPATTLGQPSLALSPDGKTIGYVGPDGGARLWDVAGRRERVRMPSATGGLFSRVYAVSFSPDGRTLASAENSDHSPSCYLKFWDATTGVERRTAWLRGRSIWSLAYAADGTLATAEDAVPNAREAKDGARVALRDGTTGQERSILFEDLGRYDTCNLAFSPDGRMLAVGEHLVERLQVWDTAGRRILRTLEGRPAMAHCMAFSPDGTKLASAGSDGAFLWDVPGVLRHADADGHIYPARALAFSGDGRTLASAGDDEVILLWDVERRAVRDALRRKRLGEVDRLALSPDGRTLVSISRASVTLLWDVAARKEPTIFRDIRSAAFSPDGRTLALAGGESSNDLGRPGLVILHDVPGGRERARFRESSGFLSAVAFAPDGRTIAAGGFDAAVRLWDVSTQQVRLVLKGHEKPVRALAFAPDGRTLASAGDDEAVILWDVVAGRRLRSFPGLPRCADPLAFSPDGSTLALGRQGRIVLLDPATGQEKGAIEAGAPVRSVAYSPDGRRLASAAGPSPGIRLWDAAGPRGRGR